jgi:ABC-2 type transport system permease protein
VNNFGVLLKRELKAITREKTIMFSIMIQFVIASLSSILLIGLMAFYDPSSISDNTNAHISIGLVQESSNPMPVYLAQKGIRVKNYADMESAKAAFKSGRVDTVMKIPAQQSGLVDMQLVLPQLDTAQTVVLMSLQEPLKKYENYLREANGITVKYDNLRGKSSNSWEFMYSLIIPILMLFPALITGSIIIDAIAEEFENKTFETLLASPVSLKQIFGAKISAAVLTAIGQIILWVLLLRFNGTVIANAGAVVMISVMAAASIALIAGFVALYFRDRERSQFIYSMILVVIVAGGTFLGFSPINLIMRLAAGSGQINIFSIAVYPLVPGILGLAFFRLNKKLVYKKN